MYGMANPTDFTDEQLRSIIDTLHTNGFSIGTSYADQSWYKYNYLGFDFNGTQTRINRIEAGNLYNIDSVFGCSDFTYTNATETDGVLTFSADGTLSPNVTETNLKVGGVDLEIWFND